MGWNFYNASGELQINDGGVLASAAVFTGNADLGSNLLVGNAGSTGIAISANGEVTMAAQPAFLARNNAQINNVTGDGTAYTLVFATEVFDQNADFDGTSTFTAPITGRYRFTCHIVMAAMDDSVTIVTLQIVASNGTVLGAFTDGATADSNQNFGIESSVLLDMDAADTVTAIITGSGGSASVDFGGSSDYRSFLCGELVA